MTSTVEINHKNFNLLFNELLSKLCSLINKKSEKVYYNMFTVLKKTQPKMPVNLFMCGVLDYKQQIKDKDEDFFKQTKNYTDINNRYSFTKNLYIQEYWDSFSSETKENLWKYFQSLFVMGEIIINENRANFDKYRKKYVEDLNEKYENPSIEQEQEVEDDEEDSKIDFEFLPKIK